MYLLKQSIAATITFGPALDTSAAPVTGLTKGGVDEVGVYKEAGTALVDLSAVDFTHRAGGMYTTVLAVGSVDTLGKLRFYVRDDSECIPIWEDFMVLPANVYDALVSGSDRLQVHTAEITNDLITAAIIATGAIDADSLKEDAVAKIADGVGADLGYTSGGTETLKKVIARMAAVLGGTTAWNDTNKAMTYKDVEDGTTTQRKLTQNANGSRTGADS